MRKKINKEKAYTKLSNAHKEGAKAGETLREKLKETWNGATLNYIFTFGKYQNWDCRRVCENDPKYIQRCMQKKILDFEKEVIDYMIKCQNKLNKGCEEAKERAQEDIRRKRSKEARESERARKRAQDSWESFWSNKFRDQTKNFRPSGSRSASVKVVSSAAQWDHLPDKQKYGQILGIQNGTQITKQSIRDLYKKRMLEYHPDKCVYLGVLMQKVSHEMTIRIQAAYEYFQRVYGV